MKYKPRIDDYQVFVWVLVGLHHNFVILRTWILKVFNKNTISAPVCLPQLILSLSHKVSHVNLCRHTETFFLNFVQQFSHWKVIHSLEMCSTHLQTKQPAGTVLFTLAAQPTLLLTSGITDLVFRQCGFLKSLFRRFNYFGCFQSGSRSLISSLKWPNLELAAVAHIPNYVTLQQWLVTLDICPCAAVAPISGMGAQIPLLTFSIRTVAHFKWKRVWFEKRIVPHWLVRACLAGHSEHHPESQLP